MIKESISNHVRDPCIICSMFLHKAVLGSLGSELHVVRDSFRPERSHFIEVPPAFEAALVFVATWLAKNLQLRRVLDN